jgi:hypothetical protein
MAGKAFTFVVLSVLVATAFAGLFGGSNDEQINRQHQRQQPQKIKMCTCDQQKQYFQELKQFQQQCQQRCTEQTVQQMMPQETRTQMQTVRECAQKGQTQAQEVFECMHQKTQEQKSCGQQEEIENQDSTAKFADHYERAINKARQMMEESYEQQKDTTNRMFGKTMTNQYMQCTNQCVVQKARQMDNAQRYNCEMRFESDTLKKAIGECQQQNFAQAMEQVCQCATQQQQKDQKQAQGADEFCTNLKQKKFDQEQSFKQY